MNRKHFLILALSCITFSVSATVQTGIEVLRADNFRILVGKKVGLVTNPTGVDSQLKSTVDILYEAPNVKLVALFGPEHGVRGDVHAGDKVSGGTDAQTGLPVYSLYGKTRKPTAEMLKGIDVLVYDIQDIGCRSFTYISTMGMIMQTAAEQNIEVVVLDRPNPLGGLKIEGNLTEDKFISFVSQFKIPYVYGLTCGELALMLNGEKMLGNPCKLTVVPMKGWKRNMNWEDTGLEWVVASPHIPYKHSAYFYPITGILGELGYMSIGVGYTLPFQLIGASWIDADKLATALNKLQLPGLLFRPIYFKPFYAIGAGEHWQGVQIHIMDYAEIRLSEVQFWVMQELNKLYPEKAVFKNANTERFAMFDKVCGSDYIRQKFSERHNFNDIKDYWYKDVDSFRTLSEKYYLYN